MQQSLIIISILLYSLYALLLIYYRHAWNALPKLLSPTSNLQPKTRISVIIPARNEENNITPCLQSVCGQSYPNELYEVLVVDDHSTDNTAERVTRFAGQNVKLIHLKEFVADTTFNAYKKKAIEIAIAQSSGELIITTDADCIVPATWLQTIAGFYEENYPVFIVMPVCYDYKNNFIELFQALDFMTLQGITGASVHKNIHSMCNGANLAYTKKAFYEAGGFTGIDNIASGDDMLLMHKIYRLYPDRIKFLKSTGLTVHTQPMHTTRDFFAQRIRWASKADQYEDKRIFAVLLLVYVINIWCAFLGIAAFFNTAYVYGLIGLLTGKTMVELFFLYPVAKFFNQEKILWWFPLAQPFHILYTIIAGWLGKFGNYQWKGRNVK